MSEEEEPEPAGACLSDEDVDMLFDDLDALKERLSLVEEIQKALSTIEARVDQLDTKLVGLCDSDMERSLMMQKLLAAREEEREGEEERAARRKARAETATKSGGTVTTGQQKQQQEQQQQQQQQEQQPQAKGFAFDAEILSHPFHLRRGDKDRDRDRDTTTQDTTLRQPTDTTTPAILSEQDKERETKRLKTERAWENYRGSFTIVLTKGYLQAVDNLRQRMMIQEYDTSLMHIAQKNGLARFEAFVAITKEPSITFEIMETLYENPKDLSVIADEHLRMRCQSLIRTEEMKMKEKCYASCTDEARRLAGVFSKTDFLSKVLPGAYSISTEMRNALAHPDSILNSHSLALRASLVPRPHRARPRQLCRNPHGLVQGHQRIDRQTDRLSMGSGGID